jgi:hypothetical protein
VKRRVHAREGALAFVLLATAAAAACARRASARSRWYAHHVTLIVARGSDGSSGSSCRWCDARRLPRMEERGVVTLDVLAQRSIASSLGCHILPATDFAFTLTIHGVDREERVEERHRCAMERRAAGKITLIYPVFLVPSIDQNGEWAIEIWSRYCWSNSSTGLVAYSFERLAPMERS